MNLEETIVELKAERDETVKVCAAAQVKIGKLESAIAALEGRTPPAGNGTNVTKRANGPNGKSVAEIVELVAREMGAPAGITVIDARGIRDQAMIKFPESADMIRRGIYNAVQTLKRKKVVMLCPGGFTVAP